MYKNNTVEEDFKTSIHDNYFVEVKEIDRQNYDETESTPAEGGSGDSDLTLVEDVKRVEKAQEPIAVVPTSVPVAASATNDTTNSKDIPDFETLKKTKPSADSQDETRLIDDQLDSSKFDEVVEDRQYVEVPVIKEEILKQTKLGDVEPKEDATVEADEAIKKPEEKKISKIVPGAVKEADNLEIMRAEARYLGQRQVSVVVLGV